MAGTAGTTWDAPRKYQRADPCKNQSRRAAGPGSSAVCSCWKAKLPKIGSVRIRISLIPLLSHGPVDREGGKGAQYFVFCTSSSQSWGEALPPACPLPAPLCRSNGRRQRCHLHQTDNHRSKPRLFDGSGSGRCLAHAQGASTLYCLRSAESRIL